jgi:hypothetical protein
MITAPDDGLLHSHEEVEQLLRYALPGARVTLVPVAVPGSTRAAASTRRYDIVLPRVGREPITTASVYSLPCDAARLAQGARAEADRAMAG